ncbi:MAG TPA: HD-GYP domain-containing protein, partial [Acidiferrobacteraceae bacterium]|nr:HD-GYP domain-containing protein [Acidiferrobacteraceae bacterium]
EFVYLLPEPERFRRAQAAQDRALPQGGAPASPVEHQEFSRRILAKATSAPPPHTPRVPIEQEIKSAQEIDAATRQLVYSITEDVRMGHTLDIARTRVLMAEMVGSILRNSDALIWMTQLKNRDEYTALHSLRVAILAMTFGHHLEMPPSELEVLGTGALLHDLGKLRVPDAILNKPDRLTPEEYEIMKTHVPEGVRLLEDTKGIPSAAVEVAQRHHERYSGRGYINGMTGDRIGLFGMIGAIVDTYDAITSDRVYRSGLSSDEALRKLYDARGREFHPGLVERFIRSMGVYPIGSVVELNTGEVGVVLTVNRVRHLRPRLCVVLDSQKRRYPQPLVLDLYQGAASQVSIVRVLPAGAYQIDPVAYLPRVTAPARAHEH